MRFLTLCLALSLFWLNPIYASGNPERGKAKASSCSSCHGVDGVSTIPNYPILAGQHRDYLEFTLRSYKNGDRKDPVMAAMAVNLSEEDIEDLAAYYASQVSPLFSPTQ